MTDKTTILNLYNNWQKSNQTQRAYCDQNKLSFPAFKNKLMTGRKAGIIPSMKPHSKWAKNSTNSFFLPVTISPSKNSQAVAEDQGNIDAPYCDVQFGCLVCRRIECRSMGHRYFLGLQQRPGCFWMVKL